MFRRRRKASDFSAETEAHILLEADRLQESGLSREEARAAARRAFGNITQAQERFYEAGRPPWWNGCGQDVRFGLRMLAKTPGFTAVAVLTLALGIGATTAIFSAVYAVLLKPIPFKDGSRLVFVEKKNPPRGWIHNPISPTEILAWREESGAFEDLAAYTQSSCVLTGAGKRKKTRARWLRATCSMCWARRLCWAAHFRRMRISKMRRSWQFSATACGGDASARIPARSAARLKSTTPATPSWV